MNQNSATDGSLSSPSPYKTDGPEAVVGVGLTGPAGVHCLLPTAAA